MALRSWYGVSGTERESVVPVVTKLLQSKWAAFGKAMFYGTQVLPAYAYQIAAPVLKSATSTGLSNRYYHRVLSGKWLYQGFYLSICVLYFYSFVATPEK
eukprot:919716-Rhodomonas_salina.1